MVGSLRVRALLLLALLVAVLLCAVPSVARAANRYTYAPEAGVTLTYAVANDGTASITKGRLSESDGFDGSLDIPAEIDGHSVTSIVLSAFMDCTALQQVVIQKRGSHERLPRP